MTRQEELERELASARRRAEDAESEAEHLEEQLDELRKKSKPGTKAGAWAEAQDCEVYLVVREGNDEKEFYGLVAMHPTPESAARHAKMISDVVALRWTDLVRVA